VPVVKTVRVGLHALRALADGVGQLGEIRSVDTLQATVFSTLEILVPGSLIANDQLDIEKKTHGVEFNYLNSVIVKLVPHFQELLFKGHHPYLEYIKRGGRKIAVRASDLVRLRDYHLNPIYAEVYKPAGVPHGLFSIIQIPHYNSTVNFNILRDRHFSDEEQMFVRVYLEQVRRTVSRLALRSSQMEKLYLDHCAAFRLTVRETEVMLWLFRGKTDKEIARMTGTSSRTVSHQVSSAFRKLRVRSRNEAVRRVLDGR